MKQYLGSIILSGGDITEMRMGERIGELKELMAKLYYLPVEQVAIYTHADARGSAIAEIYFEKQKEIEILNF